MRQVSLSGRTRTTDADLEWSRDRRAMPARDGAPVRTGTRALDAAAGERQIEQYALVQRVASWLLGGIAGAATAIAMWLLLVPWDLSELDEDGPTLERGGDDYAPQIAAVAVIGVIVGLATTLKATTRRAGPALVASGLTAWSALFAWRAGTSEVSGANMFLVPLVMVMIPATVLMPLLVRRVDRLVQRSQRFS